MSNETTLVIDGNPVDFIRKDSVQIPVALGEKRIVVGDRGWVFVGDCRDHDDCTVTIENAWNIRRWGTISGLGQLVNGPLSETKKDLYGTVRITPIIQIAVIGGW